MSDLPDPSGPELRVLEQLCHPGLPFTTQTALAAGATYASLKRWVKLGLLQHPVRGVYHPPNADGGLALRLAVLRLVVPPDCVVTDRTAGWVWGASMILAPNDHLVTPAVHVFCPPGRRLRNGLVASGERMLAPGDVAELDGIRVTTPLRTAGDLGRLLPRDQAFAALDSLAALRRFTLDELALSTVRFAGYRGVVQLRALVPWVDPRSGSPGESVLRLRWLDLGFPRPKCQVPVPSPSGWHFFLDIGLEQERLAAEYDGEEFHGDDQRKHDEERRGWAHDEFGWTIVVARSHHIHGRTQQIDQMLWEGRRLAAEAADPPESFGRVSDEFLTGQRQCERRFSSSTRW